MSILKKIFSGVIAINVIALLFISTGPNTKANNFVEEDINIAVARDYDMQTNPEPDLHCISHVGTDGVLYVTRFRPNFGSNGAIGNWYSTNGETLTGSAMTYHNGYFYHSHTGLDGKIYTRKSPNCRQNTWTAAKYWRTRRIYKKRSRSCFARRLFISSPCWK